MVPEKRRYFRYKRNFPLNIHGHPTRSKGAASATNISLGGVFFVSHVELKEGMRIDLSFIPPEEVSNRFFDLNLKLGGIVKRVEPQPGQQKGIAVEFHLNLKDFIIERVYKPIKRNSLILFTLILMNIFFLKSLNFAYFWHSLPINIYSILVATYILTRFLFALFYLPSADNKFRPSVSVIIPARNEEGLISSALEHVYAVNYPPDKYEVIVVNDNSSDGTLAKVYETQKKYKDLIVLNFKEDVGKRNAMAAGFCQAKNEIVVVIDSDSFITPDSIYNIVQDFVELAVAGVSGQTDVHNVQENALTKMQTIRYFLAFKVMKAAESLFSAVTCCPGCFSAYRRSYVLSVLEQWRGQKFLGKPCTFGDDRSLTRLLLKKYKIKHNSNALAYTVAPRTYRHFLNQQLRWKKSWFRETLLGCSFMWKKNPLMAFSFYTGFILPIISPVVAFMALIYRPIVFGQPFYVYLYGTLLVSLIYSLYYRFARPSKHWIYGLYFCFFYLFILSWQNYIAIFTIRNPAWGERGKFFKH